jgi:hypothetical protein
VQKTGARYRRCSYGVNSTVGEPSAADMPGERIARRGQATLGGLRADAATIPPPGGGGFTSLAGGRAASPYRDRSMGHVTRMATDVSGTRMIQQ